MYSAIHSCGHESLWRSEAAAPKVGERVHCARCNRGAAVQALLGPWRVLCLTCTKVNGHAVKKVTVLRVAQKHAQENAGHTLKYWQRGAEPECSYVSDKTIGQQLDLKC